VTDWGTTKKFMKSPSNWYFSDAILIRSMIFRWNTFWLRTHETLQFLNAKPNPGHYAISNISKAFNINVMFVLSLISYFVFVAPRTLIGYIIKHRCVNPMLWKFMAGWVITNGLAEIVSLISSFILINSVCKDCENNYHKYIDYVDFGSLALPGLKFSFF
jgi:hypothetical protein